MFYETIFINYDAFISYHNINNNNSLVSGKLIMQVESVLIDNTYFQQEKDTINETTQDTNEVFYYNGNYRLAMRFKGIQLFTTNERLINEYDIDMSNNSIQNVNTLTLDKLILNNVIYTDVVSSNRVLETVNEVIRQ